MEGSDASTGTCLAKKWSAMRFEDQHIVVTGGTRGIGRAVSLAFLAGGHVHATYGEHGGRRGPQDAAGPRRAPSSRGLRRSRPRGRGRLLGRPRGDPGVGARRQLGIRRDEILATMSPDDWDDVLRANLTGGYVMAKFAVQNMMRQRYGRILFTTSPAGRFGFEGQGNYSASKAGQVGLMRSLCKEVAKRKITVNCISPGFIATELLDDLPDALRDEYRKSVPAKRFGTPEEVASAVLYLASAEASYITGATLDITGGL